jgi:hypothetical protein
MTLVDKGATLRRSVELSVVVTVYSETFSIIETVNRLVAKDRGYLKEILLVVSPKSSPECMAICKDLVRDRPFVKMHIQERNPGCRLGLPRGNAAGEGHACRVDVRRPRDRA